MTCQILFVDCNLLYFLELSVVYTVQNSHNTKKKKKKNSFSYVINLFRWKGNFIEKILIEYVTNHFYNCLTNNHSLRYLNVLDVCKNFYKQF